MKNTVQNINFLDNNLPDKCADLIIADPPYFEVKGKFDFIWNSFDDYLKDVEKWAVECKRILKDNGTLFWYGDAKKIAYSQIIIDNYFDLLNSIVWENTNPHKQQIRFSEGLRTFAPLTERLLMYSNETYNLTKCVFFIRDYIRQEIEKAKGNIIFKQINEALGTATNGGGVASACLSLSKSEPAMITKEMYLKLQEYCKPFLRREYEELRRPFNNFLNLGDVFKFPNFETDTKKHETIKPEKLTRVLIQTCSKKGQTLVVPFAGSGTECAMSIKEGLDVYGFDIETKYCEIANKRIQHQLKTPTLF